MSEAPVHDSPAANGTRWYHDSVALLGIAMLPLILFWDLLFIPGDEVVSHYTADVSQFFVRMREFAVAEISQGRLPLWNPHVMSGTPFVGNWQSAIFYPLNAIYLALPTALALNVDVALHLILLGSFTYLWIRGRGVSAPGAYFGSIIVIFSGPVFLRVLAGHITMLAVLAWAPLLLTAVDRILDRAAEKRPLLGWTLVGISATALQMLAGHPQTVFITAATVGVYTLIRLVGTTGRIRAVAALGCVAILPIFIALVQLVAGLHTANESIRGGGTNREFATLFSFPPENLLTFLAPAFFGDRIHLDYWGRWAFWDSSIFMGVIGLAIALFGAVYGSATAKRYAVFLIFLFLLIAMGRYSPIYDIFAGIPGFSLFRGPSKFLVAFILFSGLLAAIGMDRLLDRHDPDESRRLSLFLFSGSIPIALGMIWILLSIGGYWEDTPWRDLLRLHLRDGVMAAAWPGFSDYFFDKSALNAVTGLLIGFVTCLVVATLLWHARRGRWVVYLVLVLGVLEVFAFARVYRSTFHLSDHHIPTLEYVYRDAPGDYRVLHIGGTDDEHNPRNHTMKAGKSGLWGYEPVFLGRYGFLMAFATGGGREYMGAMSYHAAWGSDPVDVALLQEFFEMYADDETGTVALPDLFAMLRCRYVVVPSGRHYATEGIYETEDRMPRFNFVRDYVIIKDWLELLNELVRDSFDPRTGVILEAAPDPKPSYGSGPVEGSVEILDESTDHLTLAIQLREPAILFVTDPFSSGWRATALPGSVQTEYQLAPGNLALTTLALDAGEHKVRLEYAPFIDLGPLRITFDTALRVSGIATALLGAATLLWALLAIRRQMTKNAA